MIVELNNDGLLVLKPETKFEESVLDQYGGKKPYKAVRVGNKLQEVELHKKGMT